MALGILGITLYDRYTQH